MVNNSNVRRYIKDLLKIEVQTSRNLFSSIKTSVRRPPEFNQIRSICATAPEIQYLDEPQRDSSKNGRWGLRAEIIDRWKTEYINNTEKEYLSSKAFSENLLRERKAEFEFFSSLRDIINNE